MFIFFEHLIAFPSVMEYNIPQLHSKLKLHQTLATH